MGKVMKAAFGLGMAGGALLGGNAIVHGLDELQNTAPVQRGLSPNVEYQVKAHNTELRTGGGKEAAAGFMVLASGLALGAAGLTHEREQELTAGVDAEVLERGNDHVLEIQLNKVHKTRMVAYLVGGTIFGLGMMAGTGINAASTKEAPPGAGIDVQSQLDINSQNEVGVTMAGEIAGFMIAAYSAVGTTMALNEDIEYGKRLVAPPEVELGRPLRSTL